MPPSDSKTCRDCGETKPPSDYYRDSSAKDGLWVRCKLCAKTRAQTHKVDPVKRKVAQHRWNTSPAAKAKFKRYEQTEKAKVRGKRWREANPDKIRAREAARYAADPEKQRARAQAWRDANRERRKLLRNREKMAIYNARRRARLANVEHEDYTRREIFDRDGGCCQMCSRVLKLDERYGFELDHIIPVSKGGPDIRSNLRLLCVPCNRSKGVRLEDPEAPQPDSLCA